MVRTGSEGGEVPIIIEGHGVVRTRGEGMKVPTILRGMEWVEVSGQDWGMS